MFNPTYWTSDERFEFKVGLYRLVFNFVHGVMDRCAALLRVRFAKVQNLIFEPQPLSKLNLLLRILLFHHQRL